ncbi:DUF6655 family protein [Anatilimnocola floriformis]|uniref:DUF6655 family protein n=1 Tax=Anatilimnocola floriformis TaxID=2948575 RepID=UPI0020C4B427|nr:DUF6655 family protein [Anatilimnocola floriformis]
MLRNSPPTLMTCLLLPALLIAACGCNVTKSRLATEQLVISDAVDHAVSQIDFSPLSGRRVYLDKSMLPTASAPDKPAIINGNVGYVIGSLRQQMLAYNCLLQDKADDADIIVEARLGAMSADSDEQTYGVPTGVMLHTAAAAVTPGGSSLPQLPDLSLGRRNHQLGAARIGVVAYDRATREPVWQAGIATGNSTAKDLWVLGIGPFQKGRIYDQVQTSSPAPGMRTPNPMPRGLTSFSQPQTFQRALARDEQIPARILTPQNSSPVANPAAAVAGSRN